MDTKQSPTNLELSFGVVNCLVVFPTHFNPNKSVWQNKTILLDHSNLYIILYNELKIHRYMYVCVKLIHDFKISYQEKVY